MTTKKEILKAIREKCLDCCCNSQFEVSNCSVGEKCTLYNYRFGKDPLPSASRVEAGKRNINLSKE